MQLARFGRKLQQMRFTNGLGLGSAFQQPGLSKLYRQQLKRHLPLNRFERPFRALGVYSVFGQFPPFAQTNPMNITLVLTEQSRPV